MATSKKKAPVKPRTKGRPTKYKDEYADQAKKLCLLGATDEELADFFEVNVDTVYEWKKTHKDFSESIKSGKLSADGNVASRLYERAMGFEHDSEEIKVVDGYVERVPIKKIYPPDTVAAIFWLKNRNPDKWRDKQNVEHEGLANLPAPVINVYTGEAPPLASSEDEIS